jgi:hypothetical protein
MLHHDEHLDSDELPRSSKFAADVVRAFTDPRS